MRLAVFGSSESKPGNVMGRSVTDAARFENFCGVWAPLVRGGNSVLVESDNRRSADRHVVDGMLDTARAWDARVTVFHRAERHEEPLPGREPGTWGCSSSFRCGRGS
jgi:hypothetical protein